MKPVLTTKVMALVFVTALLLIPTGNSAPSLGKYSEKGKTRAFAGK